MRGIWSYHSLLCSNLLDRCSQSTWLNFLCNVPLMMNYTKDKLSELSSSLYRWYDWSCRTPPLWGTMKYLYEKIPKDTSSKVQINRDLQSYERWSFPELMDSYVVLLFLFTNYWMIKKQYVGWLMFLYPCYRIMETAPTLPDFSLALKPDEYQLPQVDPSWTGESIKGE